MSKRSKTDKTIDDKINAIYTRNCAGIQINIMDIPKVFAVGKNAAQEAMANGSDVDEAIRHAVVSFVETIRYN